MTKRTGLTGLLVLLALLTMHALEPTGIKHVANEDAVQVTIIYDNYQFDQKLESDWGFACLVEYQGKKLLFDAGRKADLYQENLTKLGIDPKEIPALVISHEHADHTAGLPWITEINPSIKCYLPSPYAKQLKARGILPPNSQTVTEATHLYGSFYSTGDDFEAFREHGLVVKTDQGGVLITGCGHPGAVAMVEKAQKELGIKIHTLIGGLHLMQTPDKQVDQIAEELQRLGVKQICPTHCTGERSIAQLKEAFGDGYIQGGTGRLIDIL